MPALGDTREHRRAGDYAGRRNMYRVARNAGLDLEPLGFGWCGDRLPFFFGAFCAVADVVDAAEMLAALG